MTSAYAHARRSPYLLGLLAALIGLALLVAPTRGSAQAPATVSIPQITLTGAEEVPPVQVNAVGYFSGSVTANSLTFDLSADGAPFILAHIHLGAKGVNGPIVAFLFGPADPPQNAIHPTGTLTVANLVGPLAGNWAGFADALRAGDLYVNAHSVDHPAGMLRAQIPATAAPVAATPTAAPAPPATGTGIGNDGGLSGAALAGVALVVMATGAAAIGAARRRR